MLLSQSELVNFYGFLVETATFLQYDLGIQDANFSAILNHRRKAEQTVPVRELHQLQTLRCRQVRILARLTEKKTIFRNAGLGKTTVCPGFIRITIT